MNPFKLLIYIICICLLPCAHILAQEGEQSSLPDRDEMEEQGMQQASQAFGIPEDSRFYKALRRELTADFREQWRDMMRKKKRGELDNLEEEPDKKTGPEEVPEDDEDLDDPPGIFPEIDTELAVIRHYRGRYGISFPSPDEVKRPFQMMTKEELRAKMEELRPVMEQAVKAYLTTPKLPRCVENKTTKAKLQGEKGMLMKDKKMLVFDMLFIEPDDVPINKEEAFGERTVVREYEAAPDNPAALMIHNLGITCLPYRVRITRSYQFVDEGLNALKNYDKNAHGKGKLHETMQKFEQFYN